MTSPFLAEHAEQYPVSPMCSVLQVSVRSSYDWRTREPSAHEQEDGERAREIHRLFHAFRGVSGSPRSHAALRSRGIRGSRERTARLMREMEVCATPTRTKPIVTRRRVGVTPAPNRLDRAFTAQAPHRKWVSETTGVWTSEGWLSVAVVLDLLSRQVGG
jgi:putative transposase